MSSSYRLYYNLLDVDPKPQALNTGSISHAYIRSMIPVEVAFEAAEISSNLYPSLENEKMIEI
jgi:hypothetical protein